MSQSVPARRPTLLSIASAFPPLSITQDDLYEGLFKRWFKDIPNAERIIKNTGVRQRFFAWDPRVELANGSRGMGERVRTYERVGLEVTGRSVEQALSGVERARVGTFTMTTNSGYSGPGLDLFLARRLGLRSHLRRTFVGHMGCFAAFPVLRVAMDSLAARPEELVLVNASEYSSLHYHATPDPEQVVIHGLFGDASCSVVLGSAPDGEGLQLIRSHTEQLYETHELMGWHMHDDGFRMTLSPFVPFVHVPAHQLYETHELMGWHMHDDGFRMTLSPFVPFVLAEHLHAFLEKLLEPEGLREGDVKHWLIHPGGPKILEILGKQLGLDKARLRPSWHVLSEYGNCGAVTVLLVLEELLKTERPQRGEYGVMMGFGPGLTVEGMLIRF